MTELAQARMAATAATQQLDEALLIRLVTEFQGFARDLLDLATTALVKGSGCLAAYEFQLSAAVASGRMVDRGNPHLEAIAADARRLGIIDLRSRMQAYNRNHAADAATVASLVELRNALAHDDRNKVRAIEQAGGLQPTPACVRTWSRGP